jgi:nitrite reductase/ring-hydroxylating ferredoxin subunit
MLESFTNLNKKKWKKFCLLSKLSNDRFYIKNFNNKSFGAIKVNQKIKVIRNICPHAGAEICRGKISKLVISNENYKLIYSSKKKVIQCPWHGWEFFLNNGLAAHTSYNKVRLSFIDHKMDNLYLYVRY